MAHEEPTLFEKLRDEPEQLKTSTQQSLQHSLGLKIGIITLTILACAAFFPINPSTNLTLTIGSDWSGATLIAEYPFPVYKPEAQYEREKEEARDHASYVFTLDTVLTGRIYKHMDAMLLPLQRVNEVTEEDIDSLVLLTKLNRADLIDFVKLPRRLRRLSIENMRLVTTRLQDAILTRGFVNIPKSTIPNKKILLRLSDNSDKELYKNKLFDTIAFELYKSDLFSRELTALEQRIIRPLVEKYLIPNLLYSEELTEVEQEGAAAAVASTMGRIVHKGETIIANGEEITELAQLKLQAYLRTRLLNSQDVNPFWTFLGNTVQATLIYSLLIIFLYFIRKRIYDDNWKIAGISLLLILCAFLGWASMNIEIPLPLEYLIILPAFSMLAAILIDSRTAFYTTVTMFLLLAGVRGHDYESAFAIFLGSTYAAYTVRDLRSRTQVFKSIAFIFVGYAVAIIAIGLQLTENWDTIAQKLITSSVTAMICPLITLGSLFILERILNISTDLLLLEYDNLNHVLLVELSDKAPGTYQHTLTVSRLAESAAGAIGANSILAKVGAYYHDIGKMAKAEYFVENQINMGNKHDRLSPLKSATIIKNHVEDGLEIAKEYRLPQRIIDFIPMHHGTMLIQYFYNKAIEQARKEGKKIDKDDFRYRGPKPTTKEAAIVMLADTAEALSRVLGTNTREELDHAIDAIIKERLLDGQLDECSLTIQELTLIRESFVKNLIGLSHKRIKYQKVEDEETTPNPADANPSEAVSTRSEDPTAMDT